MIPPREVDGASSSGEERRSLRPHPSDPACRSRPGFRMGLRPLLALSRVRGRPRPRPLFLSRSSFDAIGRGAAPKVGHPTAGLLLALRPSDRPTDCGLRVDRPPNGVRSASHETGAPMEASSSRESKE